MVMAVSLSYVWERLNDNVDTFNRFDSLGLISAGEQLKRSIAVKALCIMEEPNCCDNALFRRRIEKELKQLESIGYREAVTRYRAAGYWQ